MANEVRFEGVSPILGVLGESNRLADSEREALIRTAVTAAAGRIPVVVGTSAGGRAPRASRAGRPNPRERTR